MGESSRGLISNRKCVQVSYHWPQMVACVLVIVVPAMAPKTSPSQPAKRSVEITASGGSYAEVSKPYFLRSAKRRKLWIFASSTSPAGIEEKDQRQHTKGKNSLGPLLIIELPRQLSKAGLSHARIRRSGL